MSIIFHCAATKKQVFIWDSDFFVLCASLSFYSLEQHGSNSWAFCLHESLKSSSLKTISLSS